MTVSRSSASRVVRTSVAQVVDDPLRLGAGGADRLVALPPGAAPLLLRRRAAPRSRAARPTRARSSASLVSPSVARIEASVASNERCVSVRRERASATIALGQAEPLGDRERLAAARQPDRQAVGRRQRLEVELDRGVARRRASCGRRP